MELSFGKNLSNLRTQRGLSQSELAQRLHVSRQAVSNWERDKSYPDLDTLRQLTLVLEVSADTLLAGKRGDGLRIPLWPTLAVLAAFLLHLALGLAGFVSIPAVLTLPGCCALMMIIVGPVFRAMFRSGNYDILAGFDPQKDSVPKTRRQMYWLHWLWALASGIFQLVFIYVYFVDRAQQGETSAFLMMCYFVVLVATVVVLEIKIKTR